MDNIFHCGATVNWVLPYAQLREPNVQGTIEILQFAISGQLKKLNFISTMGVAGHREGESLSDDYFYSMNAYSLTKYLFTSLESIADMLVHMQRSNM